MRRSRYAPQKEKPAAAPAPVVEDRTHRIRYLLGETVLLNTGRPVDLVKLETRTVGDNQYRITLVREVEGRITRRNSYYIETTDDGFICYCDPVLRPVCD